MKHMRREMVDRRNAYLRFILAILLSTNAKTKAGPAVSCIEFQFQFRLIESGFYQLHMWYIIVFRLILRYPTWRHKLFNLFWIKI